MTDEIQGGTPANPFAAEAPPSAGQIQGAETVAGLSADPAFIAGLTAHDPLHRQPFLERWERAHQAQAGTPGAPSAYAKQTPGGVDGDGARLDYEVGPRDPGEYLFSLPPDAPLNPNLPGFRQQAFEAGVAPAVANMLWKSLPQIEALPDAAYKAQARQTREAIERMPGGRDTLKAAVELGNRLAERGPLWERAIAAAFVTPAGVHELARLARRAAR